MSQQRVQDLLSYSFVIQSDIYYFSVGNFENSKPTVKPAGNGHILLVAARLKNHYYIYCSYRQNSYLLYIYMLPPHL